MNIRLVLATALVLNFTTTANASFTFTDEDESFLTSENLFGQLHSKFNSKDRILETQMVQLGAYKSAALAQIKLSKLKAQFENLLEDKISILQKTEVSDGVIYRLRVLGFGDNQSANQFCSKLKLENTDCFTVLSEKTLLKQANDGDPQRNLTANYSVQLGAYKNALSAQFEMASIRQQFKNLLDDKESIVHKSKNNFDVLHRLVVTGFSDIKSARSFCSKLKAANQDCFAVFKQLNF